jgi:hypothetical protein
MKLLRVAVIGSAGLAIALSQPVLAQPRTKVAPSEAPHSNWNKPHRVVIQVTQNDPAVINNGAQQRREPGHILQG